jgi:hypothetical protein
VCQYSSSNIYQSLILLQGGITYTLFEISERPLILGPLQLQKQSKHQSQAEWKIIQPYKTIGYDIIVKIRIRNTIDYDTIQYDMIMITYENNTIDHNTIQYNNIP